MIYSNPINNTFNIVGRHILARCDMNLHINVYTSKAIFIRAPPSFISEHSQKGTCFSVAVWFVLSLSLSVVHSWVGAAQPPSSPTWRHLAMSGDIFSCHCWGGLSQCYWKWLCEVQGCGWIYNSAENSHCSPLFPTTKNFPTQMSTVLRSETLVHTLPFLLYLSSHVTKSVKPQCEVSFLCFSTYYGKTSALGQDAMSTSLHWSRTIAGEATQRHLLYCWLYPTLE